MSMRPWTYGFDSASELVSILSLPAQIKIKTIEAPSERSISSKGSVVIKRLGIPLIQEYISVNYSTTQFEIWTYTRGESTHGDQIATWIVECRFMSQHGSGISWGYECCYCRCVDPCRGGLLKVLQNWTTFCRKEPTHITNGLRKFS